jgi:flagellar biosynthesis/type III secretory pathway M-ring protein FliF/YscJ
LLGSSQGIAFPTETEFAELEPQTKRPTASVVIRAKSDDDPASPLSEAKIQRFVANSVPNLDPNDVAVIVTRLKVIPQGLPFSPLPGEFPIWPGL